MTSELVQNINKDACDLVDVINGEKLSDSIRTRIKSFRLKDAPVYLSGHIISSDELFEKIWPYFCDKFEIPRENVYTVDNRKEYINNEIAIADELMYNENLSSGNYLLKILGLEKMIPHCSCHGYDQTFTEFIRKNSSGGDKLLGEKTKPKTPKKILVVSHTNLLKMDEKSGTRAYNEILISQLCFFRFFFERPKRGEK